MHWRLFESASPISSQKKRVIVLFIVVFMRSAPMKLAGKWTCSGIAGLMWMCMHLAAADPHAVAKPEDYVLKDKLELSSGRVLPAGTRWYAPPDIARLKRELKEGKYKGDAEQARLIVFGHDLLYNTYSTLGEGRKDGKPPLGKGEIMNCTSCHSQGGTVPYAWPFFRTLTYYGLREEKDHEKNNNDHNNKHEARSRAHESGHESSRAVMIPDDSYEMNALVA